MARLVDRISALMWILSWVIVLAVIRLREPVPAIGVASGKHHLA